MTLQEVYERSVQDKLIEVGPDTLVGRSLVGQLLGRPNGHVGTLLAQGDLPRPVLKLYGRNRFWVLTDIEAYRDGRPVPDRTELELQNRFLDRHQLAEKFGLPSNTIRHRAWQERWDVIPRPTQAVAGRWLIWKREAVERWLAERS